MHIAGNGTVMGVHSTSQSLTILLVLARTQRPVAEIFFEKHSPPEEWIRGNRPSGAARSAASVVHFGIRRKLPTLVPNLHLPPAWERAFWKLQPPIGCGGAQRKSVPKLDIRFPFRKSSDSRK